MQRNPIFGVCSALLLTLVMGSGDVRGQVAPVVVASPADAGEPLPGASGDRVSFRVPFVGGDATAVIQAALDAGPRTVILSAAGEPWISGPLFIRRDGVSLVFEPGAELVGKLGAFPEQGDSLIRVHEARGVTIQGPGRTPGQGPGQDAGRDAGATIRMRNGEDADYLDGEWRHAIALWDTRRVVIRGLRIERSGGDGVFVGGSWAQGKAHRPAEQIVIEDCAFVDHRRQGVSVISARGLVIRRCSFTDIGATWGTDPMAGIDFEPDHPWQATSGCVVSDCAFAGNRGSNYSTGVHVYLGNFDATTEPADIRVERCTISSLLADGASVLFVGPEDDGPPTRFDLVDTTISGARGVGLFVRSSAANTAVNITRTRIENTHIDEADWGGAPIYLEGQSPGISAYGGITFTDVLIRDDRARPFIRVFEDRSHVGLPPSNCVGLRGTVLIDNENPEGRLFDLGLDNDVDITLEVLAIE